MLKIVLSLIHSWQAMHVTITWHSEGDATGIILWMLLYNNINIHKKNGLNPGKINICNWKWNCRLCYNICKCFNLQMADLPTPKKQKMRDSEPRGGKSSEKWVKNNEMSQVLQVVGFPAEIMGAFLWDDLDQDHWSKITWIMVDQMNRWILVQSGFIGSFALP